MKYDITSKITVTRKEDFREWSRQYRLLYNKKMTPDEKIAFNESSMLRMRKNRAKKLQNKINKDKIDREKRKISVYIERWSDNKISVYKRENKTKYKLFNVERFSLYGNIVQFDKWRQLKLKENETLYIIKNPLKWDPYMYKYN